MECLLSVNLSWGPDLEKLPSSQFISGFETAEFFIATHGCQNCQSINDRMCLFNSLHFSFIVSLPSICKRLVFDGYKKHKEKVNFLPEMFFSLSFVVLFFVLQSEIFLLCSQMFYNPIFIKPKGLKSQVKSLPWWLEWWVNSGFKVR